MNLNHHLIPTREEKLRCITRGERPFRQWVLRSPIREYVVGKIKKPLMKALITLANRYLEPTRRNCLHPNTQILLDIQDKFFEHEDNPGRKELFKAIFKLFIAEYEHDPYYRWRIDWVIEEIAKSDWTPKRRGRGDTYWRDDACQI